MALCAVTMGDFYGALTEGVNDRQDGGAKLCPDCGTIVDSWRGVCCRVCAQLRREREQDDLDLARKLANHRAYKAALAEAATTAYLRGLECEVGRAEREARR